MRRFVLLVVLLLVGCSGGASIGNSLAGSWDVFDVGGNRITSLEISSAGTDIYHIANPNHMGGFLILRQDGPELTISADFHSPSGAYYTATGSGTLMGDGFDYTLSQTESDSDGPPLTSGGGGHAIRRSP